MPIRARFAGRRQWAEHRWAEGRAELEQPEQDLTGLGSEPGLEIVEPGSESELTEVPLEANLIESGLKSSAEPEAEADDRALGTEE